MGEAEPASPLRPLQETVAFCDERGVKLESRRLLGSWPEWPESLRSGRSRMANRFLEYFRRGQMTNHNFILVSHADCIGSALSVIPTDAGCYAVEKVGYGGYFVARHLASQTATASDEEAILCNCTASQTVAHCKLRVQKSGDEGTGKDEHETAASAALRTLWLLALSQVLPLLSELTLE
ncbi:unnamed protein product [Polarella glacialis]|uniref:Uncharacterized protein n=1 Tax=Polarella glacialis TaxID=89957 RepID=A0A813JPX4_POLGL|nr:unnamed protein product [Polarella glacialis]